MFFFSYVTLFFKIAIDIAFIVLLKHLNLVIRESHANKLIKIIYETVNALNKENFSFDDYNRVVKIV